MIMQFVSWLRKVEFHSQRQEFYRDLIRSTKRGEILQKFLLGELAIARAKHTANKPRALAIASMLNRWTAAENPLRSQVIGMSMPPSDQLLLASADALDEDGFVLVLEDICRAIENQNAARNLLLRSLISPMLIVPAAGVLAYTLSTGAIPIMEEIAPPEVWTPVNSAVRFVANIIGKGAAFILIAAVSVVALAFYALPRWKGINRFKMERINPKTALWISPIAPWFMVLSIYRDFQALSVLTTLAVLLKRDRPLKQALEDIAANGSPYVRAQMRRIIYFIEMYPLEVAKAFGTTILSQRVSARLATLTRTNPSFEQVLIEVGTTGSEEIRKQVAKAASTLNIVLLSIVGSLTLFLYMGQMNLSMTMKKEMDPQTIQLRQLERGESTY